MYLKQNNHDFYYEENHVLKDEQYISYTSPYETKDLIQKCKRHQSPFFLSFFLSVQNDNQPIQ